MSKLSQSERPRDLALLLHWPRVRFTLCASIVLGLLLSISFTSSTSSLLFRTIVIGLFAMLAFGLFEQWPRRLPAWVGRWVVQVWAVAMAIPFATYVVYRLTTAHGAPPFWEDPERLEGFVTMSVLGVLVAPWMALAALVRQKDALARHQALAFELARSELERQALDARLQLLQRQVAPHFLFNTLANVQALVDTGSARASAVLGSLIAYLRAAVPRLNESTTTLDEELQLVRAYLDLMQMRMPDRLQFALHVDVSARGFRIPPMALLTLVENAVRHGIDPSEDGGRIDIHAQCHDDRCILRVTDTGAGLQASGTGLGTGLSTLRERLRLIFGATAELRVSAQVPHGVCAELDLPTTGTAD